MRLTGSQSLCSSSFQKKRSKIWSRHLYICLLGHTSTQWFVLLKLHMYIAAIRNWGLKRALLTSKSLSFCLSCITTCQVQDWLICSRVRCVTSHQCWDSSTTAVKRWWTVGGWFSHQIGQKIDFYCIYSCKPLQQGDPSVKTIFLLTFFAYMLSFFKFIPLKLFNLQ